MKKLVPLVIDLATDWYELGAILLDEREEAQLKVIESTHGNDVKKCCKAMLRYWIDNHPEATWHQLVTALRSRGVDLHNVATRIEGNLSDYSKENYRILYSRKVWRVESLAGRKFGEFSESFAIH